MSILGAIGGLAGSLISGKMQSSAANKQAKLQEKFAKTGIQWKVEDARKAGVHPLYALGASTTSYAPMGVGDTGLASAGQDIGRAAGALLSPGEKVDGYTKALRELQLERGVLENQLLASKIKNINQPGSPPGVTVDDGGNVLKAPEKTTHLIDPWTGRVVPRRGGSDAQSFQDAYGEVAEEYFGLGNMMREYLPVVDRSILEWLPGGKKYRETYKKGRVQYFPRVQRGRR